MKEVDVLQARKQGKYLWISGIVPENIHEVEIWIYSTRNDVISKMTDVSPANPNADDEAKRNQEHDRDVWYPIVDVNLEPGMEGVASFDVKGEAETIMNGPYFRNRQPVTPEMVIPANKLEYWENSVFVEPLTAYLSGFYLRQRLPIITQRLEHCFKLLSEQWSGKIALYAVTPQGLHELSKAKIIQEESPHIDANKGEGIEIERLLTALRSTVDFTDRCQVKNPLSTLRRKVTVA